MKIYIDPGHGGSDPGAVGKQPFELQEKDFNLTLSLLLRDVLEERHAVIMTRYIDRALSLSARAAFANRYRADLFISIHANAAAVQSAEGMEVFHFPGSRLGEQQAGMVLSEMLDEFSDHRDRGVKTANFAVLRSLPMQASSRAVGNFIVALMRTAGPVVQRQCTCGGWYAVCSERGGLDRIQPKLRVNRPDDRYEWEANRMVEQVM